MSKHPQIKSLKEGEGLFLLMASQVSVSVHLVLFGSMVAECIVGGANDGGGGSPHGNWEVDRD